MRLYLARTKRAYDGVFEFDFEEKELGLDMKHSDVIAVGPVRVKGILKYSGEGKYKAYGKIDVMAIGFCSRCLSKSKIHFPVDFLLKFSNKTSNITPKEDEIVFSGEEIDLKPHIMNEIILSWPSRILCKDDCKGLCPKCGVNLNNNDCNCKTENLNPRFNVLKQLSEGK